MKLWQKLGGVLSDSQCKPSICIAVISLAYNGFTYHGALQIYVITTTIIILNYYVFI